MGRAGRPKSENKKTKRLNANATEEEFDEFTKACRDARLQQTDVIRALAAAFVVHVAESERVTLHFKLVGAKPHDKTSS